MNTRWPQRSASCPSWRNPVVSLAFRSWAYPSWKVKAPPTQMMAAKMCTNIIPR